MEWRLIPFPALDNLRSTEARQPLARDRWPRWAQAKIDFTAGLLTPLDGPRSLSSGMLSSGNAQAFFELERIEPGSTAPRRYYGYVYCQLPDGRSFQKGPYKNLGYQRHCITPPPWFASGRSTST